MGVCQWSGVAIETASTSLSSSARRKSPIALGARASAADVFCALASDVGVDVAEVRHLGVLHLTAEIRDVHAAAAIQADAGDDELVARRAFENRGKRFVTTAPRPVAAVDFRKSRREGFMAKKAEVD